MPNTLINLFPHAGLTADGRNGRSSCEEEEEGDDE